MSVQIIWTVPRGGCVPSESTPHESNSRTSEGLDSFQSVVDQFLASASRDARKAPEKSDSRERRDETAKKRDGHTKSPETNAILSGESAAASAIQKTDCATIDVPKQPTTSQSDGPVNASSDAKSQCSGEAPEVEKASTDKSSGKNSDPAAALVKQLSGETSLDHERAAKIQPAEELSADEIGSPQKLPTARTADISSADKLSGAKADLKINSTVEISAKRLDSAAGTTGKVLGAPSDTGAGEEVSPATSSGAGLAMTSGISGAQQETAMKRPSKTKDFTGQTEQKLPEEPALNARNPFPSAERAERDANSVGASNVSPSSVTAEHVSVSGAHTTTTTRALERASDLIQLHAVRLSDSTANSLRVVIKPGAGIQLSLDLRQDNGGVQVQALLDRGNYDLLNWHWAELQQHLEARGVRLAPLMNPEQSATGNNDSRRQQKTDDEPQDSLGEFDFRGTHSVPAPAHYRKSGSSWESWA